MTRNGKIARLPRDIREQLNQRLQNGEPGCRLVEWLNRLPGVAQILAESFGGKPVSEQNLSQWREGGYRDWLARQEMLAQARELASDADELKAACDGLLTDHLAVVLGARYAGLLDGWNGDVDDNFRRKMRALRSLSQDIVELRRGDHSAARLKIEQERLKQQQDWKEEEVVEFFQRWAKNPAVREQICGKCLSEEEKEDQLRQIFGLAPRSRNGDAASENQTGSN